jgi:hypothetical protein
VVVWRGEAAAPLLLVPHRVLLLLWRHPWRGDVHARRRLPKLLLLLLGRWLPGLLLLGLLPLLLLRRHTIRRLLLLLL